MNTMKKKTPPVSEHEAYFLTHILKLPTGCWFWTGQKNESGRGYLNIPNEKGTLYYLSAYRWAYLRFRGKIPKGYTVDHLCRTKECVNPDHLEPVTLAENQRRETEALERERVRRQRYEC